MRVQALHETPAKTGWGNVRVIVPATGRAEIQTLKPYTAVAFRHFIQTYTFRSGSSQHNPGHLSLEMSLPGGRNSSFNSSTSLCQLNVLWNCSVRSNVEN